MIDVFSACALAATNTICLSLTVLLIISNTAGIVPPFASLTELASDRMGLPGHRWDEARWLSFEHHLAHAALCGQNAVIDLDGWHHSPFGLDICQLGRAQCERTLCSRSVPTEIRLLHETGSIDLRA
jgi:hypothetical protein